VKEVDRGQWTGDRREESGRMTVGRRERRVDRRQVTVDRRKRVVKG
jgi:hypothetical protein